MVLVLGVTRFRSLQRETTKEGLHFPTFPLSYVCKFVRFTLLEFMNIVPEILCVTIRSERKEKKRGLCYQAAADLFG